MTKKPLVFFIVGPTASGKTDAAVYAALRLNGEVISADSIQIYRGLDKGSAKPTEEEKRGVPHHMIDVVDYLDGEYNAARFAADAMELIGDISSRGRTPIVAGGTGLYVNSLLYPLDFTEVKPDRAIRERFALMEAAQPGSLFEMLKSIDPVSAERIEKNDIKRIIRSLEIYESTGIPMSEQAGDFMNEKQSGISIEPIIAGIGMERSALYERINRRVDLMIENGLCDEALRLYEGAGRERVLSLQAIGYKQFISYFKGLATFDETIEFIKRDTRRFAKRQISWFKRDRRIKWFMRETYSSKDDLNAAVADYFEKEKQRYEREQ